MFRTLVILSVSLVGLTLLVTAGQSWQNAAEHGSAPQIRHAQVHADLPVLHQG